MNDMIYLSCLPTVMGDGRTTAGFKARHAADLHSKIADLQRRAAALRLEIQREKQKRQAAERELAAAKPDVESLLAKLMMQVAGTWKGATL